MNRARAIPLCFLVLTLHGEIIDRIAVSVGNQAITTSDIDREIRVTCFLDHKQPDFSAANRRATADRMVEQRLILRELENSRYPEPSDAEVQPVLDRLKKDTYPAGETYASALAARGISEQDIKNELLWQRRLLLFIDVRFRPGVQVTSEAIHDYFNKAVKPGRRSRASRTAGKLRRL